MATGSDIPAHWMKPGDKVRLLATVDGHETYTYEYNVNVAQESKRDKGTEGVVYQAHNPNNRTSDPRGNAAVLPTLRVEINTTRVLPVWSPTGITTSKRIWHKYLSKTRGGPEAPGILQVDTIAFMLKDFKQPYQGGELHLKVGDPVLIQTKATTSSGGHIEFKKKEIAYYTVQILRVEEKPVNVRFRTQYTPQSQFELLPPA